MNKQNKKPEDEEVKFNTDIIDSSKFKVDLAKVKKTSSEFAYFRRTCRPCARGI